MPTIGPVSIVKGTAPLLAALLDEAEPDDEESDEGDEPPVELESPDPYVAVAEPTPADAVAI